MRLYLGDSLKLLKKLRDAGCRFDLIFADPPYFLSNGGTSVHAGRRVSVDKGNWDRSNGFQADRCFTKQWLEMCRDLLTESGTLWVSGTMHNIYMVGALLQEFSFVILNDISWYKPNAPPNLACRSFAHAHETLLWAKKSKKAKHVFDYQRMKAWPASPSGPDTGPNAGPNTRPNRQMRSVWTIPLTPPSEKTFGKHPTQKPEALLSRVLLSSTLEEQNILDPFCGSGTTGVVALRHGRRFVGLDKEASFLEIARKRLEAAS